MKDLILNLIDYALSPTTFCLLFALIGFLLFGFTGIFLGIVIFLFLINSIGR